jgi:hypothetical protein
MALIDGDDFVSGDILSYQEANRLKNNFRGAVAPTGARPGMLFSDESDNKLYHCISESPGFDEVLQASGSYDTTPIFDKLILTIKSTGAVSDPPADGELDALFPSATAGFIAYVRDTNSPTKMWHVIFDGSSWWIVEMQMAYFAGQQNPPIVKTATLTLDVRPAPDFTMEVSMDNIITYPNRAVAFQVQCTGVNNFAGDITISVENLPPGVTAEFFPSATFTLGVEPKGVQVNMFIPDDPAVVGAHALTVKATSTNYN